MKGLLSIGWFLLGLIQFAAIVNGFMDALGGFFGFIAAFVLAEIPILGTVMGINGAMNNWGWGFLPSLLLFIGAPIFGILVSIGSSRRE
ncbi:TPA: hypothetical protein ENS27_09715 [bacterium]|nr:hypothetical protein [bacterium]